MKSAKHNKTDITTSAQEETWHEKIKELVQQRVDLNCALSPAHLWQLVVQICAIHCFSSVVVEHSLDSSCDVELVLELLAMKELLQLFSSISRAALHVICEDSVQPLSWQLFLLGVHLSIAGLLKLLHSMNQMVELILTIPRAANSQPLWNLGAGDIADSGLLF